MAQCDHGSLRASPLRGGAFRSPQGARRHHVRGGAALWLHGRSIGVMNANDAATIAEVLWQRARHTPDRRAYLILDEHGCEMEERSYAQLARRAHAIGNALLDVARPGDRAALLFNPGMPFLDAFFACAYAGIIAVPMM